MFTVELGEPQQEVGGVMVTLAGLCSANDIDLNKAAEKEHDRVWQPENIERIRAKNETKLASSPLPGDPKHG